MQTLTKTLMKAAEPLLQHGEILRVLYTHRGQQIECHLVGYSEDRERALISRYFGSDLKTGAIEFERIQLPAGTLSRLQRIAHAQEARPTIARARRLRTLEAHA